MATLSQWNAMLLHPGREKRGRIWIDPDSQHWHLRGPMRFKTYLFEFLVFPDGKNPTGEVYIKAQDQGETPMSDEELRQTLPSDDGSRLFEAESEAD
jgi:hypothetical protein